MEFITRDEFSRLDPKTPGQHRWIIIAVHSVPHTDIENGHTPAVGARNLVGFSVGCADCALERDEALGAPCLATDHEIAEVDKVMRRHP